MLGAIILFSQIAASGMMAARGACLTSVRSHTALVAACALMFSTAVQETAAQFGSSNTQRFDQCSGLAISVVENQQLEMVDLTFASWNQIVLWLRTSSTPPSRRLTAAKSITKSGSTMR